MSKQKRPEIGTVMWDVHENLYYYQRVCEIVYRRPANEVIVSAGLMDKNGACIVYAPVEKVEAIIVET